METLNSVESSSAHAQVLALRHQSLFLPSLQSLVLQDRYFKYCLAFYRHTETPFFFGDCFRKGSFYRYHKRLWPLTCYSLSLGNHLVLQKCPRLDGLKDFHAGLGNTEECVVTGPPGRHITAHTNTCNTNTCSTKPPAPFNPWSLGTKVPYALGDTKPPHGIA